MTAQVKTASLPGLAPIEELVQTAIVSGTLKSTIPVSLMIVAESGAGKSQTIVRFQNKYIQRVDDLTSQGLFDIMRADPNNHLRFLLIPDFNPVLSHKSSVTNLLIANLLTLMSEGLVKVADGREQKELKHKPVGIITSCTPDMFLMNHRRFRILGIIRRIIPVHYGYSDETISAAQESIRLDLTRANILPRINLKKVNGYEPLIDEVTGFKIENKSGRLAMNLALISKIENRKRMFVQGTAMYPMAPHLLLRSMARAHAKLAHRKKVTKDDLGFLDRFIQFTNMQTVTPL